MVIADRLRITEGASQFCVILLICLSVTAPAIFLSTSLPFFRAEQLLLPFIIGGYLWMLLIGVARPIRWQGMFAIGFFYCLCNLVSMWYGSSVFGRELVLRDWYELPKVFLPVIFFVIGYEVRPSEKTLRRALAWFSVAMMLVCTYAWAQFLRLGFTYRLNPYYSPGGHIDIALQYEQRVYSTMGNSNVLGQLLTWCIVLFLLAILFRTGNIARNTTVALSCLITLAMTGSRYGLLTASLGILLVMFAVAKTQRRFAQLALIVVLVPVFVWTFQTVASSNKRTLERYETLRNPTEADSFRERMEGGWREAWSEFRLSPVLGYGPSKSVWQGRVIDSEFLDVLREKGSVGFLAFLCYYLYPLYLMARGQHRTRVTRAIVEELPMHFVALHAAFIMGVTALFMDFGEVTFYTPFLQSFLWLWLGIGVASSERLAAFSPAIVRRYVPATLKPQHT